MNALQKVFFEETLEEIAEHTNDNYHTKALITLAKFFELDALVEQLNNVESLHNYFGYLTPDLASLRFQLSHQLFSVVKKVTTEKEFKKIKAAF